MAAVLGLEDEIKEKVAPKSTPKKKHCWSQLQLYMSDSNIWNRTRSRQSLQKVLNIKK